MEVENKIEQIKAIVNTMEQLAPYMPPALIGTRYV
jgi:hypothetical protein